MYEEPKRSVVFFGSDTEIEMSVILKEVAKGRSKEYSKRKVCRQKGLRRWLAWLPSIFRGYQRSSTLFAGLPVQQLGNRLEYELWPHGAPLDTKPVALCLGSYLRRRQRSGHWQPCCTEREQGHRRSACCLSNPLPCWRSQQPFAAPVWRI